jgi:hypothetical protein
MIPLLPWPIVDRRPELDEPGMQAWEVTASIAFGDKAHTIISVVHVPYFIVSDVTDADEMA